MPQKRSVAATSRTRPTIEGAGVHLQRVIGFGEPTKYDPFLLLDHFGSSNPAEYRAGFPWHPHRGMETITYVQEGTVEHQDSMGNKGVIGSGDVQWMTAGSGIIHQEMPKGGSDDRMSGFQLWANLPARQKMMHPRYQEVIADIIPAVANDSGTTVRIVAGEFQSTRGPVKDIVIEPLYVDVHIAPKGAVTIPVTKGHTAFAYVYEGEASFAPDAGEFIGSPRLVHFTDGDEVTAGSSPKGAKFLLIAGKPLGEPVAWQGPIVMNTDEELDAAFREYRNGTFLKHVK